jgi:hypothetical protein
LPTHLLSKGAVNLNPHSLTLPSAEVFVDRLPGRKVMGESSPGTALTYPVEDGIENFPHIHLPMTTSSFFSRQQWFEQIPFGITYVTGIGFSRHREALNSSLSILRQSPISKALLHLLLRNRLLYSNSKNLGNEFRLSQDIAFFDSLNLFFPDHIHSFVSS